MSEGLDMFAVVAPGLESVCAGELQRLGVKSVLVVKGGVTFQGERLDVHRANLMLRSASRVLVRMGTFRARDFPQLYRRCRDLPWGRYIKPSTGVEVTASCRTSRLIHRGRVAETVQDAVCQALGQPGGERTYRQRVFIRIEDDMCTVSIDSSGELLHRRGYRSEAGVAPLRETLAAGILDKLGWVPGESLVDPMCGSGTFLVEAALMAKGQPPGWQRDFAFKHWPKFRPGAWQVMLAQTKGDDTHTALIGSDLDQAVLGIAARNAERAGVEGMIQWQAGGFRELEPPAPHGLLVCNPPYGGRIGEGESLRTLYRDFGRFLSRSFGGWRFAFLCPDADLARLTGHRLKIIEKFSNGGLKVNLYSGKVPKKPR